MAIAFVGHDENNATSGAASQNTNTLTVPASTADGAFGLVVLFASSATVNLSVPASFTQIGSTITVTGVGTPMESRLWRVPLDAADAGTDLTIVDDVGGSNKSNAHLLVFSGVNSTTPVGDANGQAFTGQSGARNAPSLTDVAPASTLVEFMGDRVSGETGIYWQVPSALTSAGQLSEDNLLSSSAAYKLDVSGNVGGQQWTKTVTAPQAIGWTVALTAQPSSGTGHIVFQTLIDGTWQ